MKENVRQEYGAPWASFTRPDNTTTYGAGDVVADSASAATVLTFSNCSGEQGGGGEIRSALLIDSTNETTKLNADLFLFSVAPETYGNDNEAFAPTDAEMLNCVGIVSLDGTTAANLKEGNGNLVIQVTDVGLAFQCAIHSKALHGVLVARNAYVPVSEEVFKIVLGVARGS